MILQVDHDGDLVGILSPEPVDQTIYDVHGVQSNGGSSAVLNLLIPKESIASLRVPPVALTTGGGEVVWRDRTWGRLRWGGPKIKLPYDPASAARLRRGAALARFHGLILLAYAIVAVLTIADRLAPGSNWLPVATGVLLLTSLLANRWDVTPGPERTGAGDLYLAGVPEEVARRWLAENPSARLVDSAPVHRRFSRRARLGAAAGCGVAAVAAGLLASRGWPGFQVISGVLMVVALVALYRALPPGFIRFAKPGES
jgi:hypothetical protein